MGRNRVEEGGALPRPSVLRLGRPLAPARDSEGSPTGRNLAHTKVVRLGLGLTRDVTLIDGIVQMFEIDDLPQHRRKRFAARTGFDPAASGRGYRWFVVHPTRIQAWREENELEDRELMRDGHWTVSETSTESTKEGT